MPLYDCNRIYFYVNQFHGAKFTSFSATIILMAEYHFMNDVYMLHGIFRGDNKFLFSMKLCKQPTNLWSSFEIKEDPHEKICVL